MPKTNSIGICDHCGGPIAPHDYYTSKGKPRQFCSRDCRNTANSRAGNPIRRAKAQQRVAQGSWQNPAKLHPPTPTEQAARARKGRLREVQSGTWRNPGQTPAAQAINSRPHKHTGALAEAMEILRHGCTADLSPDQHAAILAYRKNLRDQKNHPG